MENNQNNCHFSFQEGKGKKEREREREREREEKRPLFFQREDAPGRLLLSTVIQERK